jgi:hypothetical protein
VAAERKHVGDLVADRRTAAATIDSPPAKLIPIRPTEPSGARA